MFIPVVLTNTVFRLARFGAVKYSQYAKRNLISAIRERFMRDWREEVGDQPVVAIQSVLGVALLTPEEAGIVYFMSSANQVHPDEAKFARKRAMDQTILGIARYQRIARLCPLDIDVRQVLESA